MARDRFARINLKTAEVTSARIMVVRQIGDAALAQHAAHREHHKADLPGDDSIGTILRYSAGTVPIRVMITLSTSR